MTIKTAVLPRRVALIVVSLVALIALLPTVALAAPNTTNDNPNFNTHTVYARKYLAPAGSCPAASPIAPVGTQVVGMHCLIEYARHHAGLRPLTQGQKINHAASMTITALKRCGDDIPNACGHDALYYLAKASYQVAQGVDWAQPSFSGPYQTASFNYDSDRQTMTAWLNDTSTREELLSPTYTDFAVAMWHAPAHPAAGFEVFAYQTWILDLARPA